MYISVVGRLHISVSTDEADSRMQLDGSFLKKLWGKP